MLFKKNKMSKAKKIQIKVVPYGAGWEDICITIDGEELYFVFSYDMGDSLNNLMEVLYFLYPENGDHVQYDSFGDRFESMMKIVDGEKTIFVENHKEARERLGSDFFTYSDLVYKGSFTWSADPWNYNKFTIERAKVENRDFDISIHLSSSSEENKEYDFKVNYRQFCYALAKGITEALEKHGFRGYYDSTWVEINLKYFIFIKAVALDKVDKFKSYDREKIDGIGPKSDFRDELDLIMQKMV